MAYNLAIKEAPENRDKYVSLAEGAEYSGYSQDYLRFRIRQGKLRGAKIGRNWLTTTEWLDEYLQKVADYKEVANNPEKKKVMAGKQQSAIAPELAKALEAVSNPAVTQPTFSELVTQAAAPFVEAVACEPEEPKAVNVVKADAEPEEELEQKIAVDLKAGPVGTFEPAKEQVVWNLGWLKPALAVVCCIGILGFTFGLLYPYLQPAANKAQVFVKDKVGLLIDNLTNPAFPEQFAASFGIIYQNNSEEPEPAEQIKKAIDFSRQIVEKQAQRISELQDEVKRYQELYYYFYGQDSSAGDVSSKQE